MYNCPKCRRESSASGFCPFDGTRLVKKNTESLGAPTDSQSFENEASSHRNYKGTDDLATRPHVSTGTIGGSAVASVLRGVLQERQSASLSLVGVELDDRYRIEKQIGEGGMGIVYLARHIVIEKAVAIKILREEYAADEAVAKRFVREARAASRIGHPNIVDVTDFGTTKSGLTYQVMEFLEGQTLSRLLRSNKDIPLGRILSIVAQIARALGAAHDKGIVHRDLKPDNIFLVKRDGREDFVKIVDFGIAKIAPKQGQDQVRLTQVGTVFGTPEYMSPEQASGRTDVDHRADIYALGIILYEMLVGRVPLRGETTVRTLAMQILEKVVVPRSAKPDLEISDDLEKVVMRALSKDREERFLTMKALLSALEEVTSRTELDLPLLLKQERISASIAQQAHEEAVGGDSKRNSDNAVLGGQRKAQAGMTPRSREHGRVTDPAFLRQRSAGTASVIVPPALQEEGRGGAGAKLYVVVATLLVVVGVVGIYALERSRGGESATRGTSNVNVAARETAAPASAVAEDGGERAALGEGTGLDSIDSGLGNWCFSSEKHRTASSGSVISSDCEANRFRELALHLFGTSFLGNWCFSSEKHRTASSGSVISSDCEANRFRELALHLFGTSFLGEDPNLVGDAFSSKTQLVEVTVVAKPRGSRLWVEGDSGRDLLVLRRPRGTTLVVRCRQKNYLEGKVTVKFGGLNNEYQCKLKKFYKKRCVKGIKNPFAHCP